jgi:Mg2+ and Co2+ transporter CorA
MLRSEAAGVAEDRREGPDPAATSVRAILFDAEGEDREVDAAALGDRDIGERRLLWIDVDVSDGDAVGRIADRLGLDPASAERLQAPPSRPHLDDFDESFHLNVRTLGDPPESERPIQVDCVVGRNWVLTAHRAGTDLIELFLKPIKGETELGRVEGPVFLSILLDWVLSGYFRALEQLEGRLDRLDESLIARDVTEQPQEPVLDRLVAVRRELTLIRRSLSAHREVFATLAQPAFDKVSSSDSAERFEVLSDRLEKALAETENARTMVMSSLEVLMTRTAQRTNDVMKILTVINAVLLPALVAAAILGMNFRQSFFQNRDLFWVVLGAMVLLGIGILAFARRKRWI